MSHLPSEHLSDSLSRWQNKGLRYWIGDYSFVSEVLHNSELLIPPGQVILNNLRFNQGNYSLSEQSGKEDTQQVSFHLG